LSSPVHSPQNGASAFDLLLGPLGIKPYDIDQRFLNPLEAVLK
jgi:hypothetical protein